MYKGKIFRRDQRVADFYSVVKADISLVAQCAFYMVIRSHYSKLGNEHLFDVVNASRGDVVLKHSPRNVRRFLVDAKSALDGL